MKKMKRSTEPYMSSMLNLSSNMMQACETMVLLQMQHAEGHELARS